ncbi:two-component system, sensor histidine kinase YesM [Paenibacillus algorifonticola]|uniref:histidine kinase n=1 Tax=Paenibacillus algorifonticola TaxID=684063 RepID=A0A1I2CE99_9BACL|nr:histidine kinase [Paenibacillus algorifonticola]SFE66679.1 two-component system, sensor histidine kinase YesM [Paenibacillus algorifonticola]
MYKRLQILSWSSIRTRLLTSVLLFTLPLIVLLLYNSFYSIDVVRNQVANSNRNMMTLYMDQIDQSLEDVDQYVNSIAAVDPDLLVMGTTSQPDEYYMAKISLSNKLSQGLSIYKSMDGFFTYSDQQKELMLIPQMGRPFVEREKMRIFLSRLVVDKDNNGALLHSADWKITELDKQYYIYHIVQSGGSYIGAWVNANRLIGALGLIDLGEKGQSLLTTSGGIPLTGSTLQQDYGIDLNQSLEHYYMTGDKTRFLVVGSPSTRGDFNLVAVIPDEKILENLPYLRRLVTFVALGSLIIVPLGLFMLRREILLPLNRILAAMKRIREGNLDVRIKAAPSAEEFQLVTETFNTMMADIQQLRIDVYEEQLSKQKAELQHLQLQINPHFFMNSLNMMYSLAQVKNYELIQELTMCLVGYFRYMFRSNLSFVSLKQELDHVSNYIRIQELRYPSSLTSSIEVPDYMLQASLPPLVIQSFVENAVKYAVTLDEAVHIQIRIELLDTTDEPKMRIVVQDTGKGFDEEVLLELQEGRNLVREQGGQVGIWNVRERLRLLYEGRAQLSFANAHGGGAFVEIILPMNTGTEHS